MAKKAPQILIPTESSCEAFGIHRVPSSIGGRENAFLQGDQYYNENWYSKYESQGRPQETNVNEITLSFRQNLPYKLENKKEGDLVKTDYKQIEGANNKPFIKVKIIPNFDHETGLEISHGHKWDQATDMFTSIMSKAVGMLASFNNFLQRTQATVGNQTNVTNRIRHDIEEQYVGSDRQKIVIPFSLFTKSDFIGDILKPLMVLTSLSYPKRTGKNNASTLDGVADKIADAIKPVAGQSGADAARGAVTTENLNKLIPGFRVFTFENPPLVDVSHSGNLFKYNNCYISNVTYNFLGPWINAGPGSDPNLEEAYKETFQNLRGWKNTVPSRADCSIEIATREPHFADDYISILKEAEKNKNGAGSSDGLVNVLTNRGSL